MGFGHWVPYGEDENVLDHSDFAIHLYDGDQFEKNTN